MKSKIPSECGGLIVRQTLTEAWYQLQVRLISSSPPSAVEFISLCMSALHVLGHVTHFMCDIPVSPVDRWRWVSESFCCRGSYSQLGSLLVSICTDGF